MGSWEIYLILFMAVIAGWLLGTLGASSRRGEGRTTQRIFEDYFVGLNYLLNDEPDEAIDTFIKALEINSETIETHLALGALLRRRGKVDKAIKVHQALLARPGLGQAFTDSTRLQLAIDYISAGLLDRAERLLNEIIGENGDAQWEALRHLITIYQTEKEWDQAISCSRQLLANPAFKRDSEIRAAAAHYCCEVAEQQLESGHRSKAREVVRKALSFNRRSIRAALILAKLERESGNWKAAIKELQKIGNMNPEAICQILEPLRACYEGMGNLEDFEDFLRSALVANQDIAIVLELVRLIELRQGRDAALGFLQQNLESAPHLPGLVELLRLQMLGQTASEGHNLELLHRILLRQMSRKAAYQCTHCGYESRNLYWLCPSCQKWDRSKPLPEAIVH